VNALESAGIDVALEMQRVSRWSLLRPLGRLNELLRDTSKRPGADLIMTHRRTYPPNFARRLSRLATPMVFDFDDALYLPPPSFHGGASKRTRYQRNFDATCAAANLVLCGNAELARNVPHGRTEILPTAIDCRRYEPAAISPATGPVIGWVGHSDNLPYLETLAGPFRELASRHPRLRILVVADRPPQIEGVRVDFRPWSLATEVSCFDDMAVGVMPLDDTPWTRAKCSFKLLQYMALGIPAVASPVGMNGEVVADGQNGVLATTSKEWFEALDRLLGDEDLRRRIGGAGRQTVVERYSLEVISPRLIEQLVGILGRDHEKDRHRQPALP
jgi:glycosyltransferase involved in cell wall biosynthesis